MKVVGVIPARFGSTRFEGKPLAELRGRPLVEHVYRNAASSMLSRLLVATDDRRIFDAVEKFGGEAVMTSPEHPSGTDRVAECVAAVEADAVVNIQGDEPLIRPEMIEEVVAPLIADPALPCATLARQITAPEVYVDENVVKVVCDQEGDALYFSRAPIPRRRGRAAEVPGVCLEHVGIYAYRKAFLMELVRLAPSPLEGIEGLEQLRILENGFRIKVAPTRWETISVDTPEDLERVREWYGSSKRGS